MSPIQRGRVPSKRASGRMRGELGRGKPLSLLSKSQVGNFPKVLGVPMVYFIFYEILGKEGGGSSKRKMNVGCGLG